MPAPPTRAHSGLAGTKPIFSRSAVTPPPAVLIRYALASTLDIFMNNATEANSPSQQRPAPPDASPRDYFQTPDSTCCSRRLTSLQRDFAHIRPLYAFGFLTHAPAKMRAGQAIALSPFGQSAHAGVRPKSADTLIRHFRHFYSDIEFLDDTRR